MKTGLVEEDEEEEDEYKERVSEVGMEESEAEVENAMEKGEIYLRWRRRT